MATLTYKSKRYELPAKTMKIVIAEEEMHNVSTMIEAYTKQFEYLQTLFDDEKIIEMLGTNDIEKVDFSEVTLVCNMVDSAYMEKINEQKMKEAEAIANSQTVTKFNETMKNYDKAQKANIKK